MFEPRVALASLSGRSDADWARAGTEHAGAAFLGGIAIDDAARSAAERMVADRDREEFLPADPFGFIEGELETLAETPITPAFNLRSATRRPIGLAAERCHRHGAIAEINAHCRQAELCAVGCGETLLADPERLCRYVRTAAETGATVSVKLRAEVAGVDLPATAAAVVAAGATILHVDAMDSEAVIDDLAGLDAFLIANNGVRDRSSVHEYLDYGADAVSVGRPSDNPTVLGRVRRATDEWFRDARREVDA